MKPLSENPRVVALGLPLWQRPSRERNKNYRALHRLSIKLQTIHTKRSTKARANPRTEFSREPTP